MFKKSVLFLMLLLTVLSGCQKETDTAVTPVETVPVLSIPGTILLPDTSGFIAMEEEEHDAVLLYCWLPFGEYPENENDLVFLTTLHERGITPVPVQFDALVRNASQAQLNNLGISISVALGNDSLKNFLIENNLPVAALIRADGTVVKACGFGCVERVLRGIQ